MKTTLPFTFQDTDELLTEDSAATGHLGTRTTGFNPAFASIDQILW